MTKNNRFWSIYVVLSKDHQRVPYFAFCAEIFVFEASHVSFKLKTSVSRCLFASRLTFKQTADTHTRVQIYISICVDQWSPAFEVAMHIFCSYFLFHLFVLHDFKSKRHKQFAHTFTAVCAIANRQYIHVRFFFLIIYAVYIYDYYCFWVAVVLQRNSNQFQFQYSLSSQSERIFFCVVVCKQTKFQLTFLFRLLFCLDKENGKEVNEVIVCTLIVILSSNEKIDFSLPFRLLLWIFV